MPRSIDYCPFLLTVINRDLMLIKVNRLSLRAEEKTSHLRISFPLCHAVNRQAQGNKFLMRFFLGFHSASILAVFPRSFYAESKSGLITNFKLLLHKGPFQDKYGWSLF